MRKLKLLFILVAVTLSGCASMTASQCQVADWARVGFSDGARGQSENKLAAYTEDCAKTNVQPDAQAYRKGWDSGIQQYCTAANGWNEGVQGNDYKAQACQGQVGHPVFSRYLAAGMQLHITNQQIDHNAFETQQLRKRLEDAPASDKEKRDMREQLSDLERDQFKLRRLKVMQQQVAP